MALSEKDVRECLRILTFGRQDEGIKLFKSRYDGFNQPQQSRVVEHVVKTITGSPIDVRRELEVPKHLALANVRILGDNWDNAMLIIGGQRFSQCWSKFNMNSFFITEGGNCIPAVKWHAFHIEITRLRPYEDLTVEYDIVEYSPTPSTGKDIHEFLFKAIQYTGMETIGADDSPKTRLNFNHPVEKLGAHFKNKVEKVELVVDGHYTLAFKKVSDTVFELDFGEETVNFSRIDNVKIHFSGGENVVDVYALSWQMARGMSGMYGLAFTK